MSDRRRQAGERGDGAIDAVPVPAVGQVAHEPQRGGDAMDRIINGLTKVAPAV